MDPNIPEPPDSPRLFRPRSVGEILSHALELYRRHWQNLIVIVAVVVVPLSLVQAVLQELIADAFEDSDVVAGAEVSDAGLAAIGLGALVVAVISVLTWSILTGAVTRAAAGTFVGRDLDVGQSYRYGLARFGSIVLVGLLTGLAIGAGFVLLVIPGFFVVTRLACSLPALVIEDRRGREALRRSWRLVEGHGWPVFGTVIVAGLLAGLVSGALSAPFGDAPAARAFAQAIASVLTMPYVTLVGILLYLDLRVRKESYDAAALAAELDRTAPA